jgi:hypothetical protein
MGVDISSCSGVLASIDEMLGFINGKNKKQVVEICKDFYEDMESNATQQGDGPEPSHWEKEELENFKPLKDIASKKTINDIQEAIGSVVNVSGEPSKYDLDTHVLHSESVQSLFEKIISSYEDVMKVSIPYLQEVNAWGSPRYNGWDVPLGEACFVFDEDACFTKTTSDEGESLSKAIGHCSITEWSEYSC